MDFVYACICSKFSARFVIVLRHHRWFILCLVARSFVVLIVVLPGWLLVCNGVLIGIVLTLVYVLFLGYENFLFAILAYGWSSGAFWSGAVLTSVAGA